MSMRRSWRAGVVEAMFGVRGDGARFFFVGYEEKSKLQQPFALSKFINTSKAHALESAHTAPETHTHTHTHIRPKKNRDHALTTFTPPRPAGPPATATA